MAMSDLMTQNKTPLQQSEVILNSSGLSSVGRAGETMLGEGSNQNKGILFGENSQTGRGSGGGPGGGVGFGHPVTGGGMN